MAKWAKTKTNTKLPRMTWRHTGPWDERGCGCFAWVEDHGAIWTKRSKQFGSGEANGDGVQASDPWCSLHSTTSCITCLQEQIHGQTSPDPPNQVNIEPAFFPLSIQALPPGFFSPFFLLTISITGESLCFLRKYRGRNKGLALLWRTSRSSCCFWLWGSSHHSQHGAGGTGPPEP